jgi:Rad52/22 family double-strand break repair protein
MSGPNGHAHKQVGIASLTPATALVAPEMPQFSPDRVKELVAALEVPFDASQIEWRVMNTTKNGQPIRGQVVPYADQRAYTDRLNALFTPAGWTRKYTIHTSANFERSKDQKIVAKVLVACELTIFGLGSHSAVGEEFADNDNAGTAAEAQAFKRSCACFGLGRYLYYFAGTWVDLDDHKRPKSVPQLTGWATADGWLQGLRPSYARQQGQSKGTAVGNGCDRQRTGNGGAKKSDVLREIERLENVVGKRMYRGLLKSVARVWNPRDIQDPAIQEKVLVYMQAAERGLSFAKAARDEAGLDRFAAVLGSMKLSSLEQVDNLKTLQEIVLALKVPAVEQRRKAPI